MSKDTKILFPTEFGPLGEKAKDNAKELAKIYDAELVLMHAVEIPHGISALFSDVTEDEIRKRATRALEKYRDALDPKGELSSLDIVTVGEPEKAIVETAKDLNVRLIIFGTKGGSGLRDNMLGSAVNYVIRNAPCPVITIRNTPEYIGFKRILVPIDLAREAAEKVGYAVRLASDFGAELYICGIATGSGEERREVVDRTQKAAEFADSKGIEKVVTRIMALEGGIADHILKFSDEIDADLICIMTQQESDSGILSALTGSVADRVVNHSQRPVISIRPERHYRQTQFSSPLFT